MSKIIPINNHLIVEPLEHVSFVASSKETYDEIGVVTAVPAWMEEDREGTALAEYVIKPDIAVGDTVYFDGWLAAKYPTGEDNKVFWLVKYEDVRAVQKQSEAEPQG